MMLARGYIIRARRTLQRRGKGVAEEGEARRHRKKERKKKKDREQEEREREWNRAKQIK